MLAPLVLAPVDVENVGTCEISCDWGWGRDTGCGVWAFFEGGKANPVGLLCRLVDDDAGRGGEP